MAKEIRCRGKVQGVFFRATTKSQADNLGISGWVRNENDGSVLILAEGTEDALNTFIRWCKTGPVGARVDDLEVKEMPNTGFDQFEIERS